MMASFPEVVLSVRFRLQVDAHDPIPRVEFMNAPKLNPLKRE